MLEVSIAAVVIAVVGWDAFRRYLARAKDESVTIAELKWHREKLDELGNVNRDIWKKLNKVATDLGALSITETPAIRGSRMRR